MSVEARDSATTIEVSTSPVERSRDTGDEPLLQVRDLRVWFKSGRKGPDLKAVDGISYDLRAGEALAIVGESGSGKSVGVRALLGLVAENGKIAGGTATYEGQDLLKIGGRRLQHIRGKDIAMVFQDAMQALNPTLTLEQQLVEHQLWHKLCDRHTAHERAVEMLGKMGIPQPERRIKSYPFQLSGGLRQRAMIAMSMVTQPKILIADEPTTAVDVTVQRQILDLLIEIKSQGTAIIMITHDLGVARDLCDRVAVMYGGRIVEQADMDTFLETAAHPYSQGLLNSTIEVGDIDRVLAPIKGTPPSLRDLPVGCPFRPRCALAEDRCAEPQQLLDLGAGHRAACWKVTNA